MKNYINFIFLVFVAYLSAYCQESIVSITNIAQPNSCTLTLELTDLDSDEGQLMVGLYDTAGNWLSKNYKGELISIIDGRATVIFKDIPYGVYAASAVHDKDKNNKLNTGMFGIPSEPYASSRGAKGRFGPPKWEDAKFELNTAAQTETIKF